MTEPHRHDHDHNHRHDHRRDHRHDHGRGGHRHGPPESFGRAFAIGIGLQSAFIVAEIVVGLAAHSLAVLSDAGHNVSDVLALAVAWGAAHLGKRKATKGRTYGLKSASILAALVNALALVFVNGAVAWEAVIRLRHPEAVAPVPVIVVSLAGVIVNGFCAWLFARGSEGDVNVRAAFLHLASDAAVAAGVALTGIAIHFTKLVWLDPVASLVVSALVLVSTWSLLRTALGLAMHAVPPGIDEDEISSWLSKQSGVAEVHDLHVWAISTTENAMTAHLVMHEMPSGALACDLDLELREHFRIHHVTLQLEPKNADCALAPDSAI
jgi:cobalt-zinc-cadmium efflux system protein